MTALSCNSLSYHTGTTQEPLGNQFAGQVVPGPPHPVGVGAGTSRAPEPQPTSRYVKRCPECRVVRGNSQFTRGYATCKFCRAVKAKSERDAKEVVTRLDRLKKQQRTMRAAYRAIEHEMARLARAIAELEREARQQESLPL